MSEVLVRTGQDLVITENVSLPIPRPKRLSHRSASFGDVERIPGIRLRLPRMQSTCIEYCQPRWAGHLGATVPGDRGGECSDRGRLIEDDEYSTMSVLQGRHHTPKRGFVLRETRSPAGLIPHH